MNFKERNFASINLADLLDNLHKIFKTNKYKYTIILENCDHSTKTLRKNLDLNDLEKRIKSQEWWRLIFLNDGLKSKFSNCKKSKLPNVNSNLGKENLNKRKDFWKKQMILKKKCKRDEVRQNKILMNHNKNNKILKERIQKDIKFHNETLPKIFEELEVSSPISTITSPTRTCSSSLSSFSSYSLPSSSSFPSSSSLSFPTFTPNSSFSKLSYSLEEAKSLLFY